MTTRFVNGQTIDAGDFVQASTGASDGGKGVVLNDAEGKIDRSMIKAAFGGDGSDSALNISSGTTNYDLGGALYFEKNFTSISITGSANVTFTNPHANGTFIVFRSQGNVTLTSSTTPNINASGCGSSSGNFGQSNVFLSTESGQAGTRGGGFDGIGGVAGTRIGKSSPVRYNNFALACGSGGGNGSSGNYEGAGGGGASAINNGTTGGSRSPSVVGGTAGVGGRGGAVFILECGGALNFTSTNGISVAGAVGTDAVGNASAGGGGGAGIAIILANTITASSGTVNVAGGLGGNGFDTLDGGVGGAGFSYVGLNKNFV